jgi:hypothetical protein
MANEISEPRAPARKTKVARVRVCTRLPIPLRDRLARYCAASGISERSVIEKAIQQYLEGTGDRALFLSRFDQLDKLVAKGGRDVEMLMEAFGLYMHGWYGSHNALSDAVKRSDVLYRGFVDRLGARLASGHRLRDEVPKPKAKRSEGEGSKS